MEPTTVTSRNPFTDTGEPVIDIQGVYKSFGENQVLQDFSVKLYKGENLVVLGKSGSGKSVLIKCIIGLMQPDRGSIRVFGKNVPELEHRELDRMRVRIGFLFQSNALYDSMTIRENLEFPLRRHWMEGGGETAEDLVMEALTNVGLPHVVDMMPSELSGGMRKRVALARTLILRPEIILYDEPTTGLDPITGREIIQLMVEVQRKYKTSSLLITHDLNCVKMAANRVAMLIEGRCFAEGTYNELSKLEDPKVKKFFE